MSDTQALTNIVMQAVVEATKATVLDMTEAQRATGHVQKCQAMPQ